MAIELPAAQPPATIRRRVGGASWRRLSRQRTVAGILCLLPFLLVNGLVMLGPTIATIYYGFTDWSGIGSATFVGLENYGRLAGDDDFRSALVHVVVWTAFFLTVPIAMGLLGAVLLSQVRRFQVVFRVLYFVPYTIASVVNAAIWKYIYGADLGIGSLLSELGLPVTGVVPLANQRTALLAVAWVDGWHWWGFLIVIFLAAMGSVDTNLYDAVKVDGGNRWREFRDVTLPGIRPTLVFVVLITIVGSLLSFDYIYIMTKGGPGGATEVIGTLLYKRAFLIFEAGYAAAMGMTMTMISLLAVGGYLLLRRRGWEI